jgi:hypothetical protein
MRNLDNNEIKFARPKYGVETRNNTLDSVELDVKISTNDLSGNDTEIENTTDNLEQFKKKSNDNIVDITTSILPEKSESKWRKIQEERKINLIKVCEKYGKGMKRPILKTRYTYSKKYKLLYCKNAKVGTTTWKVSLFLKIKNFIWWPKLKLKSCVSFLKVRHPFERLVSAYEHKVLRNHAKILGNITFEQFLTEHVIHEGNHCPSTHQCMNVHWMPYINACSYCNNNYTVIQKMETFEEDKEAILSMVGLTNLRGKGGKAKHANMRHGIPSSCELTKIYFKKLSADLVLKVYKIYQHDFESFGYSVDN